MAANRYGRIYHTDHHYINLRFPSVDARREFAEKFEKYHASHDHDGEAPRYENTAASVIGNMQANRVHDAHSVSIDGYATYEIEDYHNPTRWNTYNQSRYRPPTCCVPPLISVNRTFIDSSALTRHELSAIFMDMPDEDFQNLLASVERDGFKDPVIRMIDEQVLDGWHRYRAAKELNLLRKLRFQQWDEKDEGDPAAFAYARNQGRRHHSQAIRAQIALDFHERFGLVFGHGGDRKSDGSSCQDDNLKTREEIAKGAGISTSTLNRAARIKDMGRADEVKRGEKSAGEIIKEETIKSLWEQINPAISEWKKAREGVGHASKSMLIKATLRWEGLPSHAVADVKVLKQLLNLLTTTETNILETLVRKLLDGKDLWADDEEELAKKRQLALEAEYRMFNALDEVAPDWDTDDFIKAACDKHDWGVTKFPDLDETEIPTVWEERYNLLTKEIKEPAPWIQQMLDKMAEPTETEPEPTEAREKVKELKRKKRVAKDLWDKRIQVGRDYLGDGDSDLNQSLSLAELEKGFIESNSTSADAFKIALKLTSKPDFPLMWEKAAQYSLDELEKYQRAMTMYACDILQWERPDWSPATNWILPLIEAKKAKVKAKTETEHPDMNTLWDAFNKRLPKWKAKYAESGYKENDLVQGATEAEFFDALRSYRHSDRTGPVTAEEIQDLTDLMKKQSYPLAFHLRKLLRGDKPSSDGRLSDVDRCYVENQLRVVENAISPLLDRLGANDMAHHNKARLTADLYDVFLQYENVPTEKEMIIALLDLVDRILAAEVPETLDNEVLCPDDEADRQDMNSDLITPAE